MLGQGDLGEKHVRTHGVGHARAVDRVAIGRGGDFGDGRRLPLSYKEQSGDVYGLRDRNFAYWK